MELDDAFKLAVKKFYEGQSHQNVSKYSKKSKDFEYSFGKLEEMHKEYKPKGKALKQEEVAEGEM
jgi:hypothetical protein